MQQAEPVDPYRAMRHAMVTSQLRTNAVSDARVVAAMDAIPREAFVPAAARPLAYRDTSVPIGGGRALNVPMVTGRLLSEAALQPTDRVLLIGDASGYTAAVLALLVASVVVVAPDADVAGATRAAVASWPEVIVRDGLPDADEAAPYDVVVIDGAVEVVPDAVWRLLRDGGRLVTGLVERGVTRLASGRRSRGGHGLVDFADGDCVVLPDFARSRGFVF